MKKESILNQAHLMPFIYEGFVMDTDDPMQEGRLKIWIPTIDGESYTISTLPWATYASPLAGTTVNFPAGRNKDVSNGPVAYGFWAIPKINATVYVFFINGNFTRRVWFANSFDHQRNRSLPAGRNTWMDDPTKVGPFTDTEEPLQPAYKNARAAGIDSFERQVAQSRTEKNGADGYSPSMADPSYKDPQTYCWTTPGHNTIIMSDNATDCKIRIKSCEGNQIVLDDSNGRVYISSALGNTWLELNEDGNVYVYAGKSFSVHAQGDINMTAGGNLNMAAGGAVNIISGTSTSISAGGNININSSASTVLSSCANLDMTGNANVRIQSGQQMGLTGTAGLFQTASEIHLNGPTAPLPECAGSASPPSIIPSHEPFGGRQ